MSELILQATGSSGVITLTLNRPDRRNALNRALLDELQGRLDGLAHSQVRSLILTGAGPLAFSAGADLVERQAMAASQLREHTLAIARVADTLADFPVPVIASIQGFCLAGGAELALACDMRTASEEAIFAFPEVQLGIFPGAGGPTRLTRLIGPGAARSLLFTGRRLSASEAAHMGLVQWIGQDPLEQAREWATQIAHASPIAVRTLKQAMQASQHLPQREAEQVVGSFRQRLDGGPDYLEGLTAFREKRAAHYADI